MLKILSSSNGIHGRIGLAGKIVGSTILIFTLLIIVMMTWFSNFTRRSLLDQTMKTTQSFTNSSWVILEKEWDAMAESLLHTDATQKLITVVSAGQINNAGTHLAGMAKAVGTDLIDVFDTRGEFFASSRETTSLQEPPSLNSLFTTLSGREKDTVFLTIFTKDMLKFHGLDAGSFPNPGPDGGLLTVGVFGVLTDDWGDPQGYLMAFKVLNGDQGLVQRLSEAVGGKVSLFQKGKRVATTLEDKGGKSLAGKSMDEEIEKEVLRSQEIHIARIDVAGTPYLAGFKGLNDLSGRIIGALGVDIPINDVLKQVRSARASVIIAGILALILFSLVLNFVVRVSLRPVAPIVGQMDQLAHGHLISTLEVTAHDEMGRIAEAINTTTAQLNDIIGGAKTATMGNQEVAKKLGRVGEDLVKSTACVESITGEIEQRSSSMMQVTEKVASNMSTLNNASNENLVSLRELSASVDEMAGGANDLATQSEQTSSSVEELASAISQVADNVAELTGVMEGSAEAVRRLEESVREIMGLSDQSSEMSRNLASLASEKGTAAMQRARKGMERINDLMTTLHNTSTDLDHRSQEIENIVDIITDIASQTNLLALNAAILAAQAAQEGKGFAVVADEIRELAESTDQSIKSISQHVKDIQHGTAESLGQTAQGLKIAASGAGDIANVEEVLQEIIDGSNAGRDLTEKIAAQTDTQVKNHEQISRNIEDIASRASEISAGIREQKDTARQIEIVAVALRERSEEIRRATGEQAQTVKHITMETERSVEVSNEVNSLSDKVAGDAEELKKVADAITEAMADNRRQVEALQEAVRELETRSGDIMEKMEHFQLHS